MDLKFISEFGGFAIDESGPNQPKPLFVCDIDQLPHFPCETLPASIIVKTKCSNYICFYLHFKEIEKLPVLVADYFDPRGNPIENYYSVPPFKIENCLLDPVQPEATSTISTEYYCVLFLFYRARLNSFRYCSSIFTNSNATENEKFVRVCTNNIYEEYLKAGYKTKPCK